MEFIIRKNWRNKLHIIRLGKGNRKQAREFQRETLTLGYETRHKMQNSRGGEALVSQ